MTTEQAHWRWQSIKPKLGVYILLAALLTIGLLLKPAFPDELLTKEQLLKNYEQRVFTQETSTLLRPPLGGPNNIMVQCTSVEPCTDALAMLNRYIKVPWIEPKLVDTFNPEFSIHLILFSDADTEEEKIGPGRHFELPGGTKKFTHGVPDCNVTSYFKDHTVESVIVVANRNLPDKELAACVFLEMSGAVGLFIEPEDRFPLDKNAPFYKYDDKTFDEFIVGLSRLLAVHLSSFTFPGMNKAIFEAVMDDKNLSDLIGGN